MDEIRVDLKNIFYLILVLVSIFLNYVFDYAFEKCFFFGSRNVIQNLKRLLGIILAIFNLFYVKKNGPSMYASMHKNALNL